MRKLDFEVSLVRPDRRVKPSGRLWNPSADVYKSDDGWLVKVDLAGICSDDLEIEIHGANLTLRGCRRDTHYREGYITTKWKSPIAVLKKQLSSLHRSKEHLSLATTLTDF